MRKVLKKIANKILFPHTYNNEVFINYLRCKGAVIGENTRFVAPKQSIIDEARLDYIKIGNNCCFSQVSIIAHDYSWYIFKDAYNDLLPDSGGEVIIGNNVFVGYKSVILKNTTIGDNVIIGANSVVKGCVPSNTVWAGIPARQLCTLEEFYNKKKQNRYKAAFYRRDHIKSVKKRQPTIEEMGFFAFLFLERTVENYNKYFKNMEFNGIVNNKVIEDYYFSTKPEFLCFEDFLNTQI